MADATPLVLVLLVLVVAVVWAGLLRDVRRTGRWLPGADDELDTRLDRAEAAGWSRDRSLR